MRLTNILRGLTSVPARFINHANLFLHGVKKGKGCLCIGKISIVNKGSINIGGGCILNGKKSRIGYHAPVMLTTQRGAVINIGNHVGMSNCAIYAVERIEIGDETLVGGGVKIYDTNFHSTDWRIRNTPEDKKQTVNAPVLVGKHVFIGAGSTLLKGVVIGDHSIVAAGSIVTKSIPANEVWGGNPAKKIKDLTPPIANG